jgi:hypothetical protein
LVPRVWRPAKVPVLSVLYRPFEEYIEAKARVDKEIATSWWGKGSREVVPLSSFEAWTPHTYSRIQSAKPGLMDHWKKPKKADKRRQSYYKTVLGAR